MIPIRIALLGDSWGVPNYFGGTGAAHYHHIEWLLKYNDNHVVTNFSKNGGSNLETLERLNYAFEIDYKTDLVIWVHTEPIRDTNIEQVKEYKLQELSEDKARSSYKFAQQVKYKSGCKWLVIGGQAPINKQVFDQYHIADFVKYDWRSELADKTLPETPVLARTEFLESPKWVDTDDMKHKWVEIHHEVQWELSRCEMFPDNAHPGAEAHHILYEWIHQTVLQNI